MAPVEGRVAQTTVEGACMVHGQGGKHGNAGGDARYQSVEEPSQGKLGPSSSETGGVGEELTDKGRGGRCVRRSFCA